MGNAKNLLETKIGSQIWAIKNLNTGTFRNGEPIPEVISDEEWESAGKEGKPAWCYYDNNKVIGKKYGRLYNWFAVNDPRGLAPEGWHIPGDEEWTKLTEYLGGENEAGTNIKSKSGWDLNGTDSTGFKALPGGYRYINGYSIIIETNGYWWSSTGFSEDTAWNRALTFYDGKVYRNDLLKPHGYSVRCVKDS
jgi:uncharacterized protein (TIGR02145 family)